MPCPLISVVIPFYKAHKTLERCVRSIAEQPFKDLEMLCVDDNPEEGDDTAYVRQCARGDARIHLISKGHGGVAVSRNRGIEEARGEYICFVDADDYLLPDSLPRLVERLEQEHPDCLLYTATRGENTPNEYLYTGENYSKLDGRPQNGCHMGRVPWNKLIRRRILAENGIRFPVGIPIGEDQCFNLCLYPFCRSFSHVKEACYFYSYSEAGLSARPGERIACLTKCCAMAWEFLDGKGLGEQYRHTVLSFILDSLRAIRHAAPIRCLKPCCRQFHSLLNDRIRLRESDLAAFGKKDARRLIRLAQGHYWPGLNYYWKHILYTLRGTSGS